PFGPFGYIASWTPLEGGNPVFITLWVMTIAVGVPFFVVATSAPLLQKWFAATGHPASKDPYFLYGASNLGSMLALLLYPVLIEPNFTLDDQTVLWTIGYVLLAILVIGCGLLVWTQSAPVNLVAAPALAVPAVPTS